MPGLRPHKLACHSNISNESCKQMMEWQKQNKTGISMSVVKCTLLISSKQSNVLSLWNNWPGTYPRSASPWALCCVSVSLAKQLYLRLFRHRHPPPPSPSETSFAYQNVQQCIVSYENEWLLIFFCLILVGNFYFSVKLRETYVSLFTMGVLMLALLSERHGQAKIPCWLLVYWQWQEKKKFFII